MLKNMAINKVISPTGAPIPDINDVIVRLPLVTDW